MELISKWSAIVAGCEQAAAEHNYEGPYAASAEARAQAFAECMRDLEAACTPRHPKAEWFGAPADADGKPTDRWDSWWIDGVGSGVIECVEWPHIWICLDNGIVDDVDMETIAAVIPVRREGPPAMDVGWSVVGG